VPNVLTIAMFHDPIVYDFHDFPPSVKELNKILQCLIIP